MDDPDGFYKVLKKDPTSVFLVPSLQDLDNTVSVIILNNDVPDQVKEVFEIAKKLFVFGYFKYQLFTVSAHYGFLAVEAAIGSKYTVKYGPNKIGFDERIKRLAKDGILPPEKQEIYEACRRLRNALSHLTEEKMVTPGSVPLQRTADLINELFPRSR